MKRFVNVMGLGFGLAVGGGLVYALSTSETARLLTVFLLGALIFGGMVMLTALIVNRQWTRAIGDQRTINNYRYQLLNQPPTWAGPPSPMPDLLPPPDTLPTSPQWWGVNTSPPGGDDEVVA